MTTAHRPTFVSRKGNNLYTDIPTLQFSVKDLPSNTIIKHREDDGNNNNLSEKEKRKKMIIELKKREREAMKEKNINDDNEFLPPLPVKRQKISENSEAITKIRKDEEKEKNGESEEKEEEDEENEEENEECEDSEEELRKELEKIKQEQEEENRKKNITIKKNLEEEIMNNKKSCTNSVGLNSSFISSSSFENNYTSTFRNNSSIKSSVDNGFSLKKKWYEDTIFKNQSRKEEPVKKRFINDSVHSDFHKRFMAKTMQ